MLKTLKSIIKNILLGLPLHVSVTAWSTAYEPPEDGRKYGPKHLGATSLKCF
jgi:hypothetical protein